MKNRGKEECYDKIQSLISYGENFCKMAAAEGEKSFVTLREEICTGSNMHRGYYNPSLVYDLIVGGNKRGRILKKHTARCSDYYRYYYGTDDRLMKVEYVLNNQVRSTEYIQYRDNYVLGVTLSRFLGRLELRTVCEEVYTNGVLSTVSCMHCYLKEDKYRCFRFIMESYQYNESGLRGCVEQWLNPPSDYYVEDRYDIECQDGAAIRCRRIKE